MKEITLKWHKFNDAAIIPTKTENNAGFDIYTIEKDVIIPPFERHLFSTGIGCIVEPGWWLMGFDRGSTGSKGMHLHCGVVDNNYRGEIFVCIQNDNPYPIHVGDFPKVELVDWQDIPLDSGLHYTGPILYYPTSKALAQLIPVEMPKVNSTEATEEEWVKSCSESDRGDGKLGSSGK